MDEHFWINPLKLDRDGTGDAIDNPGAGFEDTDPKEIISNFFSDAQVAYDQLEDLKSHMAEVHYPALNPSSLEIHKMEFLNVLDNFLTMSSDPLKDILHYLQKFGVSLFQIIQEVEEEDTDNEYYEKLIEARDKMVQMIGDIQLALVALQTGPPDDITYEMLPQHMKRNKRSQPVKVPEFIFAVPLLPTFVEENFVCARS
ncbi:uncharacterized protein LOC129958907 isoform X2 [Argiope bruennichi]|uniref:Uncharacterized protein n=1 Tax=Argiope bruennichi TaxID=94029 RepID=A0A8T0F5H2_ARGBR|nr:uncharacterized protein LOC129958907 isoform X2 [Argiope bruennichi]KAF8784670.1 hypothetical protein HNY73_010318 [Argiope bruennichi]